MTTEKIGLHVQMIADRHKKKKKFNIYKYVIVTHPFI